MLRRLSRIACVPLLLSCFLFGCGGDGSHRISGNITFQGKPVPSGKIYFIPDGSKGNTGKSGWADIIEGRYDTSSSGGQGILSGPLIIAIEGIDPSRPPDNAGGAEDVTTTVLFPRYETSADLPDGDSTKDIDVPAEAAKGPTPPNIKPMIIP